MTPGKMLVLSELHILEDCLSRARDGISGIDAELQDRAYVNRQLDHLVDHVALLRLAVANYCLEQRRLACK